MFVTALSAVHLLRGDSVQALSLASRSATLNPRWEFTWLVIAAAAGESGDCGCAAQAAEHLKRSVPGLFLPHKLIELFVVPAHRSVWTRGFRKAGNPQA